MVEGKKNLPSEAELEKIERYIERYRAPKHIRTRCQSRLSSIRAMYDLAGIDTSRALLLAYDFGQAKCYRAMMLEAKNGQTD